MLIMKPSEYKEILFFSFKLLFHKSILKLTFVSLFLSLLILSSLLIAFWNALPSVSWVKVLFLGSLDKVLNSIWIFIMSSLFVFLYPPFSTIVSGFFLESISKKTQKILGNNCKGSISFLGGVIAGIRILGLTTLIFIVIILLKIIFSLNIYFTIFLQILAAGYILGKEYYEIIALQIFPYNTVSLFRKKNFLAINICGLICTFFFLLPILNLLAPIISIITMTTLINKLNKNYDVN